MSLVAFWLGSPTWLQALLVVAWLLVGSAWWYFSRAFEYGMNSGQLGRHPWLFPFECFWEELRCQLPGGRRHREEFIRSRAFGLGCFIGEKRSYTNEEVRAGNLHEEVYWAMMPGRATFWATHLAALLLGPLLLASLLALGVVGAAVSAFFSIPGLRRFPAWADRKLGRLLAHRAPGP